MLRKLLVSAGLCALLAAGAVFAFNPSASVFSPHTLSARVAASTSSQSATVVSMGSTLRVFNDSNAVAFISWGNGTATANTTDSLAMPAGSVEVFDCSDTPGGTDRVAAIFASGAATGFVRFTKGYGE